MTRVEPPPSPTTRRATTGLFEFGLLVVGAEICRHLEHPVRAAGVLFAAVALAWGIRLLTRGRPDRRWTTVVVTLGVTAAVALLVWHVAALALNPLVGDYETCMDQALTREARDTCQADLLDRLRELR